MFPFTPRDTIHPLEWTSPDKLNIQITPEKFEAAFGVPITQASELLAAKTLTISKLVG